MDYGDDLCASEFTPGQFTRMAVHWDNYRSDGNPTKSTSGPTLEPTFGPTFGPTLGAKCGYHEQILTIVLKTDNTKKDNKFMFKYRKHNKKRWKNMMNVKAKDMEINHEHVYCECIEPNKFCYQMKILDKKGDGICCEHGDGFYAIYVDGKNYFLFYLSSSMYI